jgi:hypothetical protein
MGSMKISETLSRKSLLEEEALPQAQGLSDQNL